MVTDGSAVVEKTNRLSEILHQICLSHGIHLTVVDILNKKNNAGEYEDELFDRETIHEVTASIQFNSILFANLQSTYYVSKFLLTK